jgi:hypothetical protein
MFERYTERARRVLFFARYEAMQLGSISIETEHMLLGLVREGKGLTSRLFARAGVSLESVRRAVEGRSVFRERISTDTEIPFSAEVKRVLQFSVDEADRLRHNYIGTEHLLLGLLREERSVAATILKEAGVTLEGTRQSIVELLAERTVAGEEEQPTVRPQRAWRSAQASGYSFPVHLLRPRFVPSDIVHIAYSATRPSAAADAASAPSFHVVPGKTTSTEWFARGASLSEAIAVLHDVPRERVTVTTPSLDEAGYDITVVLPDERPLDEIRTLVLAAIEQQLHVRITRETSTDGDVVTVSSVA